MKTYIATDSLNPNAVNPRYGRPASTASLQVEAASFEAVNDEEALEIFDQMIEDGIVGYSEKNPTRANATLWRAKEWHGARKKPVWPQLVNG